MRPRVHVGQFVVGWFVVAALIATTADSAGAASGVAPPWSMPVAGPVVQAFRAPATPYGSGHRGIDLAVTIDDDVRAAGDGVVTFAGAVAGALHVVVAHGDNLRTTYSFVTGIVVHQGDHVRRGTVLARAAATAPAGHPTGVMHFGLRVGDDYVDPMLLFKPVDLAELVHLAPVDHRDPMAGSDHDRSLLAQVGSVVAHAPGWLVDNGSDAIAGVVGDAEQAAFAVSHVVGPAWNAAWTYTWNEIGPEVRVAWDVGSGRLRLAGRLITPLLVTRQVFDGIGDYLASWGDCTRSSLEPEPHFRGNGHMVVTVAGLGSSSRDSALSSMPFDQLGYEPGDVVPYSYREGGGAYRSSDTFGDIVGDARRLAVQLKTIGRDHPGREVDLIGHSLGGVVVLAFLKLFYDPADAEYPPLGPAITLAAPLKGVVAASAADKAAHTHAGRAVEAAIQHFAPSLPPPGAEVTTQLAEGSDFMHRLEDAAMPVGQPFLSISGLNDIVVPGDRTRIAEASRVAVVVPGWDHSDVVQANETVATIQLALAGKKPPCPTMARAIHARLAPYVIDQLEHLEADGITVGTRFVDRTFGITSEPEGRR